MTELADVLRRDRFDRYLSRKRREELLAETIRQSMFIAATTEVTGCRDPEDNKILALAVDGKATAIVTGDKDLLEIQQFQGVRILTSQEFLSQFTVS